MKCKPQRHRDTEKFDNKNLCVSVSLWHILI
jgi:hypothetical protein